MAHGSIWGRSGPVHPASPPPSPAPAVDAATAVRVLTAIGTDPTQAFVLLDDRGRPTWASPSLTSVFDLDLAAADPFTAALHPDDAALVDEIFRSEQAGPPDTTFDVERRFELLARLRAPSGAWRWVALRLHNRLDDPGVRGMVFQLTVANQERSTVEAFDDAALGAPTAQVLGKVLETLRSGGSGDMQAAVFDRVGYCLAATSGAGVAPGPAAVLADWLRRQEGRVDAIVPVTGPHGAALGTLVTVSNFPDVRPFTRALADAVARRVGLVLEAERARDELERQAVTDPLTGLGNRRSLFDRLARPGGGPVTLALVDLDGFKAINDRHGHLVGDGVLVEVARRLHQWAAPDDVLARLGGDEFVLVRGRAGEGPWPEPGLCGDLTAAVQGPTAVLGVTVEIAVSVGTAHGDPARPHDLLAAADDAMYAAKPRRRRRTDRAGAATAG